MSLHKIYPKPNNKTINKFIRLFGSEQSGWSPNLLFSTYRDVALCTAGLDTSREKWFTEVDSRFIDAEYMGTLYSFHVDVKKYEYVEYRGLRFPTDYIMNALTVVKNTLHDEVDVWLLKSEIKDDCALGFGTEHGFIIVFTLQTMLGKKTELSRFLRIEQRKKSEILVSSNIVEKWLRELKIE